MKQNKKKCDLRSCLLCTQCLSDWLPAIDAHRQSLHFKKNEILFSEGKEVKGMFFIERGLVKVHKKWGNQKELILRIAKSSDIVGHRGLGSELVYPVSATALEGTDVCFISLEFFNQTLKVNHDFLYQLLMFFAAELKESEKRMRNLAHMPVKSRVASALLTLRKKFGVNPAGNIDLVLSRQDLASYIGATYETIFRFINELADEKAIKVEGKNIAILSEEKLRAYNME